MFFFLHHKKIKKPLLAGFSLIELMVTIGIVMLVTGLVMVRYSSFNSTVVLRSQAYELALDIREAQVFGVSVGGNSGSFRLAYGIYIDLQSPNTYLLFQDISGGTSKMYDIGEEVGERYTIDPRFSISSICTTVGGIETCDTAQSAHASIAFKRPDFDAVITTDSVANPDQITLIISTNDGTASQRVVVYSSGQISVQ